MKYLLIIMILTSCSGYKLRSKNNPFAQFGIKSVSIPMFHNFSSIAGVSPTFTKSIYRSMLSYKGLTIKSGNARSDAVLIGIIDSAAKRKETIIPGNQKSAFNTYNRDRARNGDLFEGRREEFVVPTSNQVELQMRIIIIKHPTPEEIEFLKKSLALNAKNSKIIFNESFPLVDIYNIKENQGAGISVLGTQNRGVREASLNKLARKAATSFEDTILYAF